MRRRVTNIATVVSLVLLVTTCVLWPRSYRRADTIRYEAAEHGASVASAVGRVFIRWDRGGHPAIPRRVGWHYESDDTRIYLHPKVRADWDGGSVLGFNVVASEGAWWKLPDGDWDGAGVSTSLLRGRPVPLENGLPDGYVSQSITRIVVPHWLLAALAAALPVRWLWTRRGWLRDRRRERGLCPSCGYDLRASAGRCPECGAVPEPAARPAA